MRIPRWSQPIALGWALGALLYGAPIALLHVRHNRTESLFDALYLLLVAALLYGAGMAAAVVAAMAACRLRRVRARGAANAAAARSGAETVLGLALFSFLFWFLYFNYGLTYDEIPGGGEAGVGLMLAVLTGRLLLVAGAVSVVAALANRRALAPLAGRRGAAALWALAALAVAAHVALPLWYRGHPPAPPPPAPAASLLQAAAPRWSLTLIGVDGADWRVVDPLLAAGRLPNLGRMVAGGTRSRLRTLPDSNSAVIWATIYSGQEPRRHGILDFFRIRLPGMQGPGFFPVHRVYFKEALSWFERLGLARFATVTRRDLVVPPIWEVVDLAGQQLVVVDGYFYSYPAMRPSHPASTFVAYGADSAALASPPGGGAGLELASWVQPPALATEVSRVAERGDFHWQTALLRELLARGARPRLTSLYTHEPDTLQHQTWRGYEPHRYPRVAATEIAALGGAIPGFYEDLDRFLGELLAALGPTDGVVLVSDHGHSPTILHSMDTQHRHGPPGMLVLYGAPFAAGREVEASVYDLFPTLLCLLDLPLPADAPGRVLEQALTTEALAQRRREIPSYGALAARLVEPAAGRDPAREREELEKLKALGYVN